MSRKIQEEIYRNGKRSLSLIKTLIKHVFLLFYLRELLMSFRMMFPLLIKSIISHVRLFMIISFTCVDCHAYETQSLLAVGQQGYLLYNKQYNSCMDA